MKQLLITLLLLFAMTVPATAGLYFSSGSHLDTGVDFVEEDATHWTLNLTVKITNQASSARESYNDDIKVTDWASSAEESEVDASLISTHTYAINLEAGADTTLLISIPGVLKSDDWHRVSFYAKENGEWVKGYGSLISVPSAKVPSYITAKWTLLGWGNDKDMGVYMNPQLTIYNASSTEYTDTLGLEYSMIKDSQAYFDNEWFNSTVITVPANDSLVLPLWFTELDTAAESYDVFAYILINGDWTYLQNGNFEVPATIPVPDNPDNPDNPRNATGDIIVLLKSGQTVGFMFDEKPVVETGKGTSLTIRTAGGQQISYNYDEIKRIYFGDDITDAIETLRTEQQKPTFHVTANGLDVNGLATDDEVSVYTIDGALAAKTHATGGQTHIELSKKAVYIVRTKSGVSFKFINK